MLVEIADSGEGSLLEYGVYYSAINCTIAMILNPFLSYKSHLCSGSRSSTIAKSDDLLISPLMVSLS